MEKFLNVTFNQLLLYGVHVGHSFSNSVLYSAWLVYTYMQNILIINLSKSIFLLKTGFSGIANACVFRGPVWFINLDNSAALYVKYAANACGEMNWTTDWVNGFISNYLSLYRVYRKLRKYSPLAHKGRQKWVLENLHNWMFTRLTWPRAIFVSSVYNSYFPVKEALYLGIPCLGVVDTNVPGRFVSMPLPGNDESINCLVFYMI